MITWLASYPRSGNTLFRIVLKQVYGLDTYSVYGDADIERMGAASLIGHKRFAIPPELMQASTKRYIVKTHGLGYGRTEPAIYLVRDGRDALVSHAHYHIEIEHAKKSFEEALEYLLITKPLFGGWGENARSWIELPNTTVVKYEELLTDPVGTVDAALANLGILVQPSAVRVKLPTFAELHAKWPEFFRRGQSGAWNDEMSPEIEDRFWQLHGTIMEQLGYPR